MTSRQSKGAQTREKVVLTAMELFQQQGYAATSINQIIKKSGQPRGSLYFHFPGGKREIAAYAAQQSSQFVEGLIENVFEHADSPVQAVGTVCSAFAAQLESSDYQNGCPISPMATSAGEEASVLRDSCARAYNQWIKAIEKGLGGYGVPKEQRSSLASLVLSSIEGAILLSQARRTTAALDALPQSLAPLLDGYSRLRPGSSPRTLSDESNR